MTEAASLTLTRIRLAGGAFDTENRYIRQVSDPSTKLLNMARGPAIGIQTQLVGSSNVLAWNWRWRVGDATQVGESNNSSFYGIPIPDGFNTPIDAAL